VNPAIALFRRDLREFVEPPASGQRLARNYPAPIDHAEACDKALELFSRYKAKAD
jgi:hypothetical protein